MLRRVALVRTDVSEALSSSETSVLTRATRPNIPEDVILLLPLSGIEARLVSSPGLLLNTEAAGSTTFRNVRELPRLAASHPNGHFLFPLLHLAGSLLFHPSSSLHLRTEADPVFETSFSIF
jgi:hypothetical protein